ncbi:TetR/AcrR family transcriptional regulator [Rhizobium sp. BK251]|uniref:TetR/AcrR family transcriptional regulator n=1 Tax=Rhizobium sp. BK251 TaxID=2512125 RepID=UPI0010453D87|nr:TetR/AcrR family transcriptional regulator [Rhizobium sp. BK251]TCL75554.1 TetR family transcriptional regulator [Rhizobium sp. BK251]
MIAKENIRPGGRSARVQSSVHKAVRELLKEMDRSDLTIPLVATRAGVTPSTIYRRWGDLQELLGDVAVERLQPDGEPLDTGTGRSDLRAWVEQFVDEMSSAPGRALVRDVLATPDATNAGKCCSFTKQQLAIIAKRAEARGEPFADVDVLMDYVVAPIMYRILFDDVPAPAHYHALIDVVMPEQPQRTGLQVAAAVGSAAR